ncbi:PREDICTED: uncharacterized protein LOC109355583 isoform X2 [Lupinus angustifolius]|uniref:uncharacterized protein LOC109355583 isoform X2 n=1 Tax=Lupinus angustifolius TaxID=3871 RepID=UPI00092F72F6|nr:PREDICTED: uncharacterized protein LOC109355583 isoform X2 [Lupinus angustifolius]
MALEMFFWREIENLQLFQNHSISNLQLLSGPPSSGKTSLLFHFAFNVATLHSHSTVIFICNRHTFHSKPPFLSQGMDPSSHIFHRIQMKYLNDDQDIRNYFSAFHLYHTLPAAVLIDDFPLFFHNNQQHGDRDFAMAKTLALCHNAITYANQKGSCKLLLSDTHTHQGDIPRFNFIYKKWIHTTFTIQEGDVPGSFILKDRSHSRIGNRGGIKAAKYSVALQYLVLDGIIDDQVE